MKKRIFCLILVLILSLEQLSAFAYVNKADINNLPPYASMDLSKRKTMDINITNDDSTGLSTSDINSKLNEILKPKLAQEGIDFRINVKDSPKREVFKGIATNLEGSRVWEPWYDSGVQHYVEPQLGHSYYSMQIRNGNVGVFYRNPSGTSGDSFSERLQLPGLDSQNYYYRCSVELGSDDNYGNSDSYPTRMVGEFDYAGWYVDYLPASERGNFRVRITRCKKFEAESLPDRTIEFNTTDDYYTPGKVAYEGQPMNSPVGLHFKMSYKYGMNKKLIIKNYKFNNAGTILTSGRAFVYLYSDYARTKLVNSYQILEFYPNKGSPQGENIVIDYSSETQEVVSFKIVIDPTYANFIQWMPDGSPNYMPFPFYKNGDGEKLEGIHYSENLLRPSFISEDNTGFNWREGAEKYYVSLSNYQYAENMYGEGKAKSLAILLSNNIVPVKIGNSSLKSDTEKLIKDNDGNGRFIDGSNLDAAVQDLTNYVLNRVKVNLDLASNYHNYADKSTLDTFQTILLNKLQPNYMDISINNYKMQKSNVGVYPIDRYYCLIQEPVYDPAGNIQTLSYYDEAYKKFVNTNVKIRCSNYTSCVNIKSNGEVIVQSGDNVDIYIPNGEGLQLIKSFNFPFTNYEEQPYYVGGSYSYGLVGLQSYLENDKYLYLSYLSTGSGHTDVYKTFKFNLDTGELIAKYEMDDPVILAHKFGNHKVYASEGGYTEELGISKLGAYKLVSDSHRDRYLYTPDGNCIPVTYFSEMYVNYPVTEQSPYSIETLTEASSKWPAHDSVSEKNYIAYIGSTYLDLEDLSYSNNITKVASKLKSNNAAFVGISKSSSISKINRLISANSGKGKYIDNTNMTTAINELADYIISTAPKTSNKVENGSYVVVSENETPLEFEAGGLNNTTGVQTINPSAIRGKEYIPVDSNGNYTLSKNSSDIVSAKVYCYGSNLALAAPPLTVDTNNRFTLPQNTCYIKILCQIADTAKGNSLTIIDNSTSGGESLDYKPSVSDIEKDTSDIMFKFDHDNKNIAGVAITNPPDKLSLSGVELSSPIERFTKAGTYKISMFAKDIPKQIFDTTNVLPNGDAETVNASGGLSDWNTWTALPNTTFTRRTNDYWTIAGNGSFEIVTSSVNNGSDNSACYYKDISVSPNTSYTLSGLVGAHRCYGYFVTYEMDDNYKIIRSLGSNVINNNATPQTSSLSFTTGFSTTKLRVHILKGATTSYDGVNLDYLFADNITLVKMLPNPLFNEYRKTSTPATAKIYAHRLPRAEFTYQIENSGGSFKIKNLADNQLSYDPDHTNKANKGIINSQWRWAEIQSNGTTTWHDGKLLDTTVFSTGTQVLMWYRVQDADGPNGIGAWSLPKVVGTDGSLADPVALFTALPNPLPIQNSLEITDQSYSTNFGGSITLRSWTIQKLGGAVQTLTFDSIDAANSKYYKSFASLGFGKYTITLTVADNYGKVSKPYSQTIDVIDTINPTVSASPSSGTFSGTGGVTTTVTCTDNTWSTAYNRGLKTINYAWSKSSIEPQNMDSVQTINIPTESIYIKNFTTNQNKEGTWYLYVKDQDYAGNTNNGDAYTRYGPYTVILNQPPTVNITKILPSYIYEGDTVKIQYKPSDPDGDTLTSDMKLTKNGTVIWTKTKTITPSGNIYGTEEEKVLDKAEAGVNYKFTVIITDKSGEKATDESSIDVHELGINGKVDHTDIWKSNWVKYNLYLSNSGKSTYGNDTFFTGENYLLSAVTTDIAAGSVVTASNVSVTLAERTYSPVRLTKQNPNNFKGEMWDEDMKGTRWRGKYATFSFAVTYSNGTIKTDSVKTFIVDDDYWRIKMAF